MSDYGTTDSITENVTVAFGSSSISFSSRDDTSSLKSEVTNFNATDEQVTQLHSGSSTSHYIDATMPTNANTSIYYKNITGTLYFNINISSPASHYNAVESTSNSVEKVSQSK
jgi:hypothetical protein